MSHEFAQVVFAVTKYFLGALTVCLLAMFAVIFVSAAIRWVQMRRHGDKVDEKEQE